jgi:hypothetical protein
MKSKVFAVLTVTAAVLLAAAETHAAPPFSGTIFIDPDIITPQDATAFVSLVNAGRGMRLMFDRRVNNWVNLNAFLFTARYSDGLTIEVQVNPEFSTAALARAEAQKYSPVIGRLPNALRLHVATVWIQKGTQPFGGGNNNLLIHTGQADQYTASGILEETLVHEAAHTSLDAAHAAAPGWLAAQTSDNEFISTYARDNPTREDIAESFLPWLAVRYRADRISASLADTIRQTIPNRLAYFDSQAFALQPIIAPAPPEFTGISHDKANGKLSLTWTSRPGKTYRVMVSSNLADWQDFGAVVPSGGAATSLTVDTPAGNARWFLRVREQ